MKWNPVALIKLKCLSSFRIKLILGFLGIVILMAGVSAFSYIAQKNSATHFDRMIESVIVANRIANTMPQMSNNLEKYFFDNTNAQDKEDILKLLSQDESDIKLLERDIHDDDGLGKLNSLKMLFVSFREQFQKTSQALQDKQADTMNLLTQAKQNCQMITDADKELILAELDYDNTVKEKLNRDAKLVDLITIIALITIAVLSVFVAVTFSSRISGTINQAIRQLNMSAQRVAEASNQLATSTQQLSQGSAEQASSIEETSSILQETASMLSRNAENTKDSTKLTELTKESANKGNKEMQEMMNSIQEIKKSSDQIAKIIKVIDDIAFQTNILALNAAIEAARAGVEGAGFAVVAEEVRNLAGRSAQAAKDTALIIESNIKLSGKGVLVAERIQAVLQEITSNAEKVNKIMAEISSASQEQSQGVDQVNIAMNQVQTVTQQNAMSAEESASVSEELRNQAESLKEIVQGLSKIVNGEESNLTDKLNRKNEMYHLTNNLGETIKAGPNLPFNNKQYEETKIITPEDVIPFEKGPKNF